MLSSNAEAPRCDSAEQQAHGQQLPAAATRWSDRLENIHPKFYFFDAGVYRAIRPRGPLDTPDEIDCAALETLVFLADALP